jgi:lysophospholipase L1-like esterase
MVVSMTLQKIPTGIKFPLYEGVKLINEAIDAADKAQQDSTSAKTTSENALSTSQSAETKADSVQEQFNQVVIDGDSSVEAAQARVDAEGNSFTTLKDRLDTSDELLAETEKKAFEIDIPAQNNLHYFSKRMKDGLAVTIECRGDSTYYGHASGVEPLGTQTAEPPPATFQKILRSYFNNNNIVVTNNGVNGHKTSDVISSWDSWMSSSVAEIIYVNYGINDGKDGLVSADQYRDNLRQMVRTARSYGKVIILETPNVVLQSDYAQDGMGNPSRAENIKQYANIMRQVSIELNVPLVDNYRFTHSYVESAKDVTKSMPDGMHPSDDMYKFKASQMAIPFIFAFSEKVKGEAFIPAASPYVRGYGFPDAVPITVESESGAGRFAQSVKIALFIDDTDLSAYLSLPLFADGSNNFDVFVNTVKTVTLNQNDPDFAGNLYNYPINLDTLVAENLKRGLNIIEIVSNDTGSNRQIGFYYLKLKKNDKKKPFSSGSTANPTNIRQGRALISDFRYTQPSTGEIHIITDIPTSNTLNTVEVEVQANLVGKEGFCLFGHNKKDNKPRGGFLVFLNSSGFLSVAEGGYSGGISQYINITQLESVNLAGVSHKYRVTCTTAGLATVFVDGVQKGTYQLTKKYRGGFFGFYRNVPGDSQIDKVTFYS